MSATSRPAGQPTGEARVLPTHAEITKDVAQVRSKGIASLRSLSTPALRKVAVVLDLCDQDNTEPAPIVEVLRSATSQLGGGTDQDMAEYLLGLAPGTALWPPGRRQAKAAELYGVGVDAFRKKPQRELIDYLGEVILGLCQEAGMRRTRVEMEQRRSPADSRLAVQWVERFEAYYRIWTPVYALAANLGAALETYTHEPADHYPWDPDGEDSYEPEWHARGYARSALYNFAQYHLELKRFMSRYGGLWLASDTDVEHDIADAIYRIGWHNSFDDDDESWLRRQLADSRREETEHFWNIVRSFKDGLRIHNRWQDFVLQGVDLTSDEQKASSQVWLTIAACQDYTRLIDEDWLRIADWYRPGSQPRRDVSGKTLYEQLLTSSESVSRSDRLAGKQD